MTAGTGTQRFLSENRMNTATTCTGIARGVRGHEGCLQADEPHVGKAGVQHGGEL